jgi:hypothetical protein
MYFSCYYMVVVIVVYPLDHGSKPLWINQSTAQPSHSWADFKAVYQYFTMPSLLQGTDILYVNVCAEVQWEWPLKGFHDQSKQKWHASYRHETRVNKMIKSQLNALQIELTGWLNLSLTACHHQNYSYHHLEQYWCFIEYFSQWINYQYRLEKKGNFD